MCAVLWRERLKAGHAVLNRRIVGAFLTAVVLRAAGLVRRSPRGITFVRFLSVKLVSLLIALISLILLIRRVREASSAS